MASLAQKVLSAGTLADPSKLSALQEAVGRSVVIDDSWDILKFVEQLKDLSGGKVRFATIPVVDEQGWSDDGQQSVVRSIPPRCTASRPACSTSPRAASTGRRTPWTSSTPGRSTVWPPTSRPSRPPADTRGARRAPTTAAPSPRAPS